MEIEAMMSNRDEGFVEHGQNAQIEVSTLNGPLRIPAQQGR